LGAWASDTNISIRKLGYFFGAQEICAQRIALFLRTLILKETNKSPLYLYYLKKTKFLISVRRPTDKVSRKRIERMKGIAYRSMNRCVRKFT